MGESESRVLVKQKALFYDSILKRNTVGNVKSFIAFVGINSIHLQEHKAVVTVTSNRYIGTKKSIKSKNEE